VKHVAANHGGDVGVWSSEGTGSTFTLRLPAHRGDWRIMGASTRPTDITADEETL
jgi:two-component system sensor histidine kinase SenX3